MTLVSTSALEAMGSCNFLTLKNSKTHIFLLHKKFCHQGNEKPFLAFCPSTELAPFLGWVRKSSYWKDRGSTAPDDCCVVVLMCKRTSNLGIPGCSSPSPLNDVLSLESIVSQLIIIFLCGFKTCQYYVVSINQKPNVVLYSTVWAFWFLYPETETCGSSHTEPIWQLIWLQKGSLCLRLLASLSIACMYLPVMGRTP